MTLKLDYDGFWLVKTSNIWLGRNKLGPESDLSGLGLFPTESSHVRLGPAMTRLDSDIWPILSVYVKF